MPRSSILSAAERNSLLALPDTRDDLIRYYRFSETDLAIIRRHRGPANRLGSAVQLCYLRFPGIILPALDVIERVCSEALTCGTRQVYEALTAPLADHHRRVLDALLAIREGTKGSGAGARSGAPAA